MITSLMAKDWLLRMPWRTINVFTKANIVVQEGTVDTKKKIESANLKKRDDASSAPNEAIGLLTAKKRIRGNNLKGLLI